LEQYIDLDLELVNVLKHLILRKADPFGDGLARGLSFDPNSGEVLKKKGICTLHRIEPFGGYETDLRLNAVSCGRLTT
jgi:hypothetical protein